MKKTKYLDFYKKCLKTGVIPKQYRDGSTGGLCGIFGDEVIDLFRPSREDCIEYNVRRWGYWAADDWNSITTIGLEFGPTRQNIVLLLSAINGELKNK